MENVINVADLKPHPKNSYFFEDIEGKDWDNLLDDIRNNGIRVNLIVSEDGTIISGHQRYRAAKELGIEEVKCTVKHYDSENDMIEDLILINLRQRFRPSESDPIYSVRRVLELKRINDVKKGNNQHQEEGRQAPTLSADDIYKLEGITKSTFRDNKAYSELPEKTREKVKDGTFSLRSAAREVSKLSEDEQIKFIESIPAGKKLTQKEVKDMVADIKERDERIQELESSIDNVSLLIEKVPQLQEWIDTGIMTPEILEEIAEQLSPEEYDKLSFVKVVDNTPDDYEKLRHIAGEYYDLKRYTDTHIRDYKELEKQRDDKIKEITELKDRIKDLETRSGIDELQRKLEEEAGYFQIRTYNYIQQNGGSVWITEKLNELPEKTRKEFISSIYAIDAFAKQMIENIGGYGIE